MPTKQELGIREVTRPHSKIPYMTKLIFWEFGYLINLLKINFFLKIYIMFIQTKLRNVYVQGSTTK